MKNFSILSVFLFCLYVALSVQAEEEAPSPATGDDLSERRLVFSKTNQVRVSGHFPQQGMYGGAASYFPAAQQQLSPFGVVQPSYGYPTQYQSQYPAQYPSHYPAQYPSQYPQQYSHHLPAMSGVGASLPSYMPHYQYQHGYPTVSGLNFGLNGLNAYPGYVRNSGNRACNSQLGFPSPTPTVTVGVNGLLRPRVPYTGNYGYGMPSSDYGVIPNVLSGLSNQSSSFRSNNDDGVVTEEN